MMDNEKQIRRVRRLFARNRWLTLSVLTVCVCTIVSISIFPTGNTFVNVLVYLLSGILAIKEVIDLIRNHRAETSFERTLMIINTLMLNGEEEGEE